MPGQENTTKSCKVIVIPIKKYISCNVNKAKFSATVPVGNLTFLFFKHFLPLYWVTGDIMSTDMSYARWIYKNCILVILREKN